MYIKKKSVQDFLIGHEIQLCELLIYIYHQICDMLLFNLSPIYWLSPVSYWIYLFFDFLGMYM